MKSLLRVASLILLSAQLSACSAEPTRPADETFAYALAYELDNRATATGVVPRLAERHAGTSRGAFWSAYADLEAWNRERYAPVAARHGLVGGGWKTSMKTHASRAAEWLFPDRFIGMLAKATREYMDELNAVPAPSDSADRQFLQYIRRQEAAQVEALAHAAEQRFGEAEQVLRAFLAQERSGA